MEEVNLLYLPFLLSYEIFNFNVHNLVDSGASVNVMTFSISMKVNARGSKTSA